MTLNLESVLSFIYITVVFDNSKCCVHCFLGPGRDHFSDNVLCKIFVLPSFRFYFHLHHFSGPNAILW